MKKVLILSLLTFVGFATHAFAADGFTALAPIPDLTAGVTADSAGLATFFNNLYKYLIGIAAMIAVIEIIWGGLQISTQDSISKQGEGRERITQALLGLVLVLSPVLVFSIINPSILNLSLNLPELDVKSGGPVKTALPVSKLGCDDPSLTAEQKNACTATQKVIGTNPSAPAGSEDIKYYFAGGKEVYDQTLAGQVKACNDGGGKVSGDSLYIDRSNSRCSSVGEKYAKSNGYTGCKLLVSLKSVCFSK